MRMMLLLVLAVSACGSDKLRSLDCDQTEICNGRDDDCDNLVDEGLYVACDNACGTGWSTCSNGTWGTCSARVPSKEICNGRDDDCDGKIDNIDIEFCYTRDPSELTQPTAPCAPGLYACQAGARVCTKETKPGTEICNQIDDDCDGVIDDGVDAKPADVVFVIDNSGSMIDKLSRMRAAISNFASVNCQADAGTRCAVVGAPDPDSAFGSVPHLQTNFASPAVIAATMAAQGYNGVGDEDTIGAIMMLIDPLNPLRLSWRPNAVKTIVIFADEEPQSYSVAENYQTVGAKIANVPMAQPLAAVYVFTDPTSFFTSFSWNVALGAGHSFSIMNSQATIEADLQTILRRTSCGP